MGYSVFFSEPVTCTHTSTIAIGNETDTRQVRRTSSTHVFRALEEARRAIRENRDKYVRSYGVRWLSDTEWENLGEVKA